MKKVIRLATIADLDDILILCEEFHKASKYDLPFDPHYAMRYIKHHLQDEKTLTLVLLEEGLAVGCFLGLCTPHLFLPLITAVELVWWVDPAFRGRESLELLKAFEQWAIEEKKADLLCVTSHMEDPRLEVYYKRRKYTHKEVGWYKRTCDEAQANKKVKR